MILQAGLIVKIRISKSANKFLEKLDANARKSVLTKIGILKTCLETQNVYPPEELDIKKLKGELKGFSIIRVGKMRVIFEIGKETDEIFIYEINFRGNIYD
ncbi:MULTISPECIES: type II toxin-antitoxin system RelE/ParE family toxin [unclassified Microcystis]|uniref:type II toxin-antitoxin system RelE family toxin n=1 Tax=unclassified Microcystis TaxID=2643300 RepID=UPI0011929291|nr:type II toxin-antitoxin system RelE/ParE family toxin [Microcystis sp. M065S2]MCA2618228.1 type II toxin-antitoxin system RelE/ParE family toxin [Microcystis sp. M099S2]MCA2682205.1 type II toxin-antitoxin system RelE/ParE family toxin [Microcystis sp. M043S2]MCA2695154.1 type II toxin-antitoxin system RelE/ParE family toxin [Microcystis sp. M040S2]MCA2810942.1 type II toxin-antitoxin system RelE/ParE family toxin [Microcystis sp. M095S1]MCA2825956.1 type II toxin-antitoxin system RelE/ParE